MPFRDIPFQSFNSIYSPWLPIKIVTPHTGQEYSTFGLIDTGASACAIPADLAPMLGLPQNALIKCVNAKLGNMWTTFICCCGEEYTVSGLEQLKEQPGNEVVTTCAKCERFHIIKHVAYWTTEIISFPH